MTSRGEHASEAPQAGRPRKPGGRLRLRLRLPARLRPPARLGLPATLGLPARQAIQAAAGIPARLRSVNTRWLVIVPAVAGAVTLASVLAYLIAGGSQPAHPRPVAYASANPDTTEPTPQFHVPARVVPVTLPSTGAIPMPFAEQPQARTWKAGPGGAALTAVFSQAGDVAQASGLRQYVDMKQACVNLAASVSQAQAAPPIPDAAMQARYSKALSELAKAAAKCQAGISEQPDGEEYVATTENQADLSVSARDLAAGSTDLYQATGGISALGLTG